MRLIDADALKNLPFERMIHTDFGDTAIPIEEIDNVPTVDSRDKACEDCVYFDKPTTLEPCRHCTFAYKSCFKAKVKEERPQGEWIYNSYGNGCGNWHCSECGIIIVMCKNSHNNFCPNCGADMRGEKK